MFYLTGGFAEYEGDDCVVMSNVGDLFRATTMKLKPKVCVHEVY